MDPADRKFFRNALRLELLTADQLQRCIEEQKTVEGRVSLRDVAIGLGLLSVKDAQQAAKDEAEPDASSKPIPRGRPKSIVVEEVSLRPDPRSEGVTATAPKPRRAQTGRTAQSLAAPRPASEPLTTEATSPPGRTRGARPVNRRWDADSKTNLVPAPDAPAPTTASGDTNARWLTDAPPTPSLPPAAVVPVVAGAPSNATIMLAPAPIVSFVPPEPAPRVLTEPPPPPAEGARVEPGEEPYLVQAVALALAQGASDLHLHSGAPLVIRVDGRLVAISGARVLAPEAAEHVVTEIMSDAQRAVLDARGEVEFAWMASASTRCRVNAYRQQRGLDAVLRLLPTSAPKRSELGLPPILARLVALRSGLVLCAGPAGSGKSTTLATLLAERIAARPDHVVTIEAPVEHVLQDGLAFVTQHEVGPHAVSFPRALGSALREDPDVVAVTDLRHPDTIELVLAAAESGRLVFATLAASSARQALHTLVTTFPAEARGRVRASLAASLCAIVTQHLVPRASGRGRCAAVEVVFATDAVRELVRGDALAELADAIKAGREEGMITLDESLAELVREGTVAADEARRLGREQTAWLDG